MRSAEQNQNQVLARAQIADAFLFASLELSRSSWLVTLLSPGSEKMSKYSTAAGDGPALFALLTRLRGRAERLKGRSLKIVGYSGSWSRWLLGASLA